MQKASSREATSQRRRSDARQPNDQGQQPGHAVRRCSTEWAVLRMAGLRQRLIRPRILNVCFAAHLLAAPAERLRPALDQKRSRPVPSSIRPQMSPFVSSIVPNAEIVMPR